MLYLQKRRTNSSAAQTNCKQIMISLQKYELLPIQILHSTIEVESTSIQVSIEVLSTSLLKKK